MMKTQQVLPDTGLSKYVGEWVVICNDEVIAHSDKLIKIKKEISKCKTTPTIARIPKEDTLIF